MKKILTAMALFLAAAMPALGQTADELALKASEMAYYQGKDGKSGVSLVVTDARGRTRRRDMTILRYDIQDNGEQKYYVYFHKPSDVKGTAYVVWKHAGKDDDRWLYLPALDLIRRVAASDKRSSFVGTTFTYEDISGRSPDRDHHELLEAEGDFHVLKNTPKDAGQVEFASYKVWVDKNTFIPMKAEYYDASGKAYRLIEVLEVEDIQGHKTIVKMKATDRNSGSSTIADFKDVVYDIGLKADIFTERYLRNPPRQWIKEGP
ncbi:MAG: outer membrane lipoprotein-sorting protein [Candidatus Omnitrophota bacterium]